MTLINSKAILTIITPDYVSYALALRESIFNFNDNLDFFIYFSEKDENLKNEIQNQYANTYILNSSDLDNSPISEGIKNKYANSDEYRWSMKPVLLKKILDFGYQSCLYFDCDIFFYSSPDLLFNALDINDFILTPHFRSSDPFVDEDNFLKIFKEGIYNGGFIGVNKNSLPILDWWAKACLFRCEKNISSGLYVDQKYLDFIPSKFDGVGIIRHPGCNLAEWNFTENKRNLKNGNILINDNYPIIFIHFSSRLPENILFGNDILLMPYLNKYVDTVKKYNNSIDIIEQARLQNERRLSEQQEIKNNKKVKSSTLKQRIIRRINKIFIQN